MKKRILALALAGTTAFSVFGSALSANAYGTGNTTDTYYDVDAYVSYTPVASTITSKLATEAVKADYIQDKNKADATAESDPDNWKIEDVDDDTITVEQFIKNYIYKTYSVAEEYDKKEVYSFVEEGTKTLADNDLYERVELVYLQPKSTSSETKTYIRYKYDRTYTAGSNGELGTCVINGEYNSIPLDGEYYVLKTELDKIKDGSTEDGQLGGVTLHYEGELGDKTEFNNKNLVTTEFATKEYKLNATELAVVDGKISGNFGGKVAENAAGGYTYKKQDGKTVSCADVDAVIKAILADGYEAVDEDPTVSYVLNDDAKGTDTDDIAAKNFDKKSWKAYRANITIITTETTPAQDDAKIEVSYRYLNNGTWTDVDATNTADTDAWEDWTFNSDMTGEASVYPFKVTSNFVTENGVTYLKSEKTEVPTIYAYDFIPETIPDSSVGAIANNWNADNLAGTTNAIGEAEMVAEDGPGSQYSGSIRYDVVTEWEEFLEELSLDKYWLGHGLGQFGFKEFCDNYSDMFYNDPRFDGATGLPVTPVKVDLYNIRGLLWDIWQLRTAEEWAVGDSNGYYNANTSELIYLMQQYDKYIGDYINKTEVTTDEWGDLLLSILDAATEEDFKDAQTYRRYQNKVEDLRDAYETATTLLLVERAEWEMYDLLTTTNSSYAASKTTAVDKTALSATMGDLYFNVKIAPSEYTVMPSTHSNNVTYSNYNYLVASVKGGSITDSIFGTNNLYFGSTLSEGYYSLYPMADYYEAGNDNEVYPGNFAKVTTGDNAYDTTAGKDANYYADGSSTDEYQWFWNVYQLAANMNADNNKQGSVDAVNDALNAAVAELAVTTTPASMDVGAMEDAVEEYAGKIDTDYNEGYYAKYAQATEYAENVAEGLWQTRIAAMINGVAGEALTYQGTQVTITKNDMKTVEEAIKNGNTALEAIKADKDYNAAQVNALNEALDDAEYLVSLYEGTVSAYNKDLQSVNHVYTSLTGDKDQMVKSDLTAAIEAIDAAINYSEIIMGWSKNDAGKWMYGTEEGYLNDGWHQVDGGKTWFYFNADGTAKQSEWWNDNGTWYWFNSNCGAATGWAKVDGEWYFFKGNNAMKTGWEKVDGNWYYMASSGKMVTGWCEVNGKWYYFSKESNSLGQMLYSTTVDGYKLGADGAWIK